MSDEEIIAHANTIKKLFTQKNTRMSNPIWDPKPLKKGGGGFMKSDFQA